MFSARMRIWEHQLKGSIFLKKMEVKLSQLLWTDCPVSKEFMNVFSGVDIESEISLYPRFLVYIDT